MEEKWIRVDPVFDGKPKKLKNICCKITFSDSVSIILEDDDVNYLIGQLGRHKMFKKFLESVMVDG